MRRLRRSHGPARPAVLFVQITADRYGSDRSLLVLVRGLTAAGWSVTVVVPYEGPLCEDLSRAGAAVEVAPVGAFRRVFSALGWGRFVTFELPRSAWHVFRSGRRADLVHVNTALMLGGAIGARLSGRPVVWHIRESFADHQAMWRLYGPLMRMLADAVIPNSSPIADEARRVGLGAKSFLIHDGMDFPPLDGPRGAAFDVVSVGRINAVKGHEVLVDALALLRDQGVVLTAAIAGDTFRGAEAYAERLRARISDRNVAGQVRLLGFVDDVPALLRACTMFVFASVRPESFGFALVEAMSLGAACIATAHGGPLEIVRDEETGLLIEPGDATALAGAILRLWRDAPLRARLGRSACSDVRARFDASETVGRVLALYDHVLAPRQR